MATAGGASSIITQVQQGGPPINAIGDVGADETIAMDLRGTRFVLSRDELLTLPEFVLLSLFPNGLFPEGHMGGFADGDAVQVDYDPASLQYMLDFFRTVAQSIPTDASPSPSQDEEVATGDSMGSRDDSSKRAGIIVLREDLDFYVIPPQADITQPEMMEVKRAAGKALLQQSGIFSGLKRSDEPGTTEAHLIEMLTAGGFNHDDNWGHRAGEPNKAVVCSLALARLRSDIRGNEMGSNAVGMAQKLLLFWRKPARRCWWEGVELENVEGVQGKLKDAHYLAAQKTPYILLVARGTAANIDEDAPEEYTGHSQLRAFGTRSLGGNSQPFNFAAQGTMLGWRLQNPVGVAEEPIIGGIWAVKDSMRTGGQFALASARILNTRCTPVVTSRQVCGTLLR
ncbi:putative stress response protein Whi2 [Colletotrichum sublineola]|uniref:Putative stress response protein Whi2 n=1 Tax=Colletotrichum sublineola TaxID=1173701 RepID=A0A066XUR3_COLSU|nr:putative stress response protein Whi2 [Colletotrichum sublineola]